MTAVAGAISGLPASGETTIRVTNTAATTAATPQEVLAAVAAGGRNSAATYAASFLAPADAAAAVAALVNGYREAVDARLAEAQADPSLLSPGRIPFWAFGVPGVASTAADGGWAVDGADGPAVDAVQAWQVLNTLGPLAFGGGNFGTVLFNQNPDPTAPSGARPVFNAANMGTWLASLGDLGGSNGTIGWILNNTFGSGDGGIADATGLLQTTNRLGPAVFNLNVLKYINFVQPPNGETLPDGQLDAVRAVDIGQWEAGIPGLLYNTGTTGFVTNRSVGVGLGNADFIGGLQTTLYVGPVAFTFNFLPSGGFSPLRFVPSAASFADPTTPAGVISVTSATAPTPVAAAAPPQATTAPFRSMVADGAAAEHETGTTQATAAAAPAARPAAINPPAHDPAPALGNGGTAAGNTTPPAQATAVADQADDAYVGKHRAAVVDDESLGKHRAAADANDTGTQRSADDENTGQHRAADDGEAAGKSRTQADQSSDHTSNKSSNSESNS
ncbi:hypothetical protein LV457_09770 [Mycobacterium sp. MYCO198283]|uniref:hypothetical protein n=1 Tax=Mycobacterium sp. MYCO198283 TaxID=2883505 RepID=UPI001E2D14BB|nr:hypothetical protein [Mycobacterium sp. MYCO198283]MCG5432573.1 hypothetical protein [Mycobacterium sp. MYCO198283]